MAQLGAGHGCGQRVVGKSNLLVDHSVRKVILTLCHGSDKDAKGLVLLESTDVFADIDDGSLPGQGDLAAVGRKVLSDGVLDDLQELLGGVGGADGKLVEKLDHQTGETLEGTRNTDGRVDFDKNTLRALDVHLELAGFVDRRVEEG
jgi:hypothetical protein